MTATDPTAATVTELYEIRLPGGEIVTVPESAAVDALVSIYSATTVTDGTWESAGRSGHLMRLAASEKQRRRAESLTRVRAAAEAAR